MPAGGANSCDACDARRGRAGGRPETLPYGTVRLGAGEIIIGVESLAHVTATQRSLFEQAVAAAGLDPDDVLVVRITETGVHVAVLDTDDERWPVRTVHVAADELSARTEPLDSDDDVGLHDAVSALRGRGDRLADVVVDGGAALHRPGPADDRDDRDVAGGVMV